MHKLTNFGTLITNLRIIPNNSHGISTRVPYKILRILQLLHVDFIFNLYLHHFRMLHLEPYSRFHPNNLTLHLYRWVVGQSLLILWKKKLDIEKFKDTGGAQNFIWFRNIFIQNIFKKKTYNLNGKNVLKLHFWMKVRSESKEKSDFCITFTCHQH